jgi:hypothetical protein
MDAEVTLVPIYMAAHNILRWLELLILPAGHEKTLVRMEDLARLHVDMSEMEHQLHCCCYVGEPLLKR